MIPKKLTPVTYTHKQMNAARTEWYQKGKEAGRRELQIELRDLLGLVSPESFNHPREEWHA